MADGFAPYIQRVAMDGPWNDLNQTIDRFTKRNGVIVRAKAMTYLERKPEAESSLVWNDRFVLAASNYDICTNRTHFWETAAIGCCALLLCHLYRMGARAVSAVVWIFPGGCAWRRPRDWASASSAARSRNVKRRSPQEKSCVLSGCTG